MDMIIGNQLGWEVIGDVDVAAEVKVTAPDAPVGSEEAIDAFKSATQDLNFDEGSYGGKALKINGGGRSAYLTDLLEVSGKTPADVQHIVSGNYINSLKADPDLANYDTLGDKIRAFNELHPR